MNNSTNDLKVMEEGEVGKECAQTLKLLPSLTGKTEIPGTTRTSSFVSKSEKNAIIGPPKGSRFIKNDGRCQTNGLPTDVKRCGVKGWFAFVPSFMKLIKRIPRRPSYNVPVNVRQCKCSSSD
jgi:hypothetical protein